MQLLSELKHDNIVRLVRTYLNHLDRSVAIVFLYAEYDFLVRSMLRVC
jgi:hypothetical protein